MMRSHSLHLTKRKKPVTSLLLCLLVSFACAGQQVPERDSSAVDRKKLRRIIAVESIFYLAGMSYLQFVWYRDHERVPFHLYPDAKGYLQVDKFGHAFGAYIESYYGYKWLRNAGVPEEKALIFGAPLGFVLQFPIEVFDGIYEGYGFSMSDVAANAAGASLVAINQLVFHRQLIKYKFSYHHSIYAKMGNGYLGENALQGLFYDYNAHTYWLSAPINVIPGLSSVPAWLCLSVGYSANGMYGEFSNRISYLGIPLPNVGRYRQWIVSADIDLTEINTPWKKVNTVLDQLFWIKVPLPAIEFNQKLGVQYHAIYY